MDMHKQSLEAVTENFMADEATRNLLRSAELGDADAQYHIGWAYAWQAWYDEVSEEAVKWLELAAQQGHLQAQYDLALFSCPAIYDGDLPWLQDDHEVTLHWMRAAAESGHQEAMARMAELHERGLAGAPKDLQEAANWYLRQAKAGGSVYDLCSLLELLKQQACQIAQEDETLVVDLVNKAAEEANHYAERTLGNLYAHGLIGLAADDGLAVKWHSLAAAEEDEVPSYFAFDEKDIEVCRRNAERCGARLQRHLGQLFQKGEYLFRSGERVECDLFEAARWYELSAKHGDADAQLRIARMYDQGQGVSQDEKLAARWYKKAAQQGLATAQYALGTMYDNGRGVPLSYRLARSWFRLAAAQGDTTADYQLGLNYLFGKGVRENRKCAETLFRHASTGSHVLGTVALAVVTAKTSDFVQAVELLFQQHQRASLGSMQDSASQLEEFRKRLEEIANCSPITTNDRVWLEQDWYYNKDSQRIWCRKLSFTARFATTLRGILYLLDDDPDEIQASSCFNLATKNGDRVAAYYWAHLDWRNGASDMSFEKYACSPSCDRDGKPEPDYSSEFLNSVESRLSELMKNFHESQVKKQEAEDRRQAEIKAAEDEHKRTLSFLTHTLNNTLSTGPETVRTVIDILGSDLYHKGQEQYKAINNMASLFPVFLFVESLLKTFKLYVSDPEQLREKWDSDRSGDASIALVLAMALRQSVARFVFSSNHLTQLRRLLPSQDKEAIKRVRKSFVDEMIPLELSVETAGKVFDWIKLHFGMLQIEIDADAEMHFSSNATRHMFFFAAFSELVYNALKYTDGKQPIQLRWYRDGSDYCFTCLNSFPVEARTRPAQEGANGGLFFIEKLMSMLRESTLSYTYEGGEYRTSLRFDHNNFREPNT